MRSSPSTFPQLSAKLKPIGILRRESCGIHCVLLPERSRGYASAIQSGDRGNFDGGMIRTEQGSHLVRLPGTIPKAVSACSRLERRPAESYDAGSPN
jgi:hypothetical protein